MARSARVSIRKIAALIAGVENTARGHLDFWFESLEWWQAHVAQFGESETATRNIEFAQTRIEKFKSEMDALNSLRVSIQRNTRSDFYKEYCRYL